MKKLIFFISLLILSSGNLLSQSGWFWQNPEPCGSNLEDVFFVDQSVGYAVGWDGSIIKSSNGGLNWNQLLSTTNYYLNSIHFINRTTGFVTSTGWQEHSNSGAILKTTNGGFSWTSISFGMVNFAKVYFLNDNTGYACGMYDDDYAVLYRTTNCGQNWSNINNFPSSFCFMGIQFINEFTGYISDYTKILKTTNAGITWDSSGNGSLQGILEIFCCDVNTVYAVGNYGRIFKSSNGGNNWERIYRDTTTHFTSIVFLNNYTGFVCGKNRTYKTPGKLIKTTNGGSSWDSIYYNSTSNLSEVILIPNSNNVVMSGLGGEILFSSNEGSNWISLKNNLTSQNLSKIHFINSITGFILGYENIIMKSTSSGNNWFALNTGTTNKFLAFSAPDENHLIVCGENGTIVKSTNSGINWSSIPTDLYLNLNSVYFVNPDTGYMTGDGNGSFPLGRIYKTINGGLNWVTQLSENEKYYTCYFLNSYTGFVSRASRDNIGRILRTTNGGVSWNPVILPHSNITKSFFFVDSITGFAGGFKGDFGATGYSLLKTTNSGVNWFDLSLNLPYMCEISSVNFCNANTGFLVTRSQLDYTPGGDIFKTTNAGIDWYRFSTVSNFPMYRTKLNSVYFINNLSGYVVGDNGTILSNTIGGGIIGIQNYSNQIPIEYGLHQNYPNPFNPVTKIKFDIPNQSNAKIIVYDLLGSEITTLVNEQLKPGSYSVDWDGTGFASGVYFYSLVTEGFVETKRMVLVK